MPFLFEAFPLMFFLFSSISLQEANKYKNAQKSALPPHIFMVADMTHQAMVHNKSPQVCTSFLLYFIGLMADLDHIAAN